MATEYKLSYAASEIDRRLGMVDDLNTQIGNINENIPAKVSDLENDSGFITSGEAERILSNTDKTLTETGMPADAEAVGEALKQIKINIPTKVSEFENDAGYLTEVNNITPEQTTFFNAIPSENLLDVSTMKEGMLHTNGRIYTVEDNEAYGAYKYSEQYIPVSEGDILAVQMITLDGLQSSFDSNAAFSRVVAYDKDKQVLSSLGGISTAENTLYFYTVPASVSFVRICLNYTNSPTNIMITRNATEVLPYQPYEGTYMINEIYLPEQQVISVDEKVNLPKDENGNIQYGINGQVLQTNGDGSTRWAENNAVVNSVTPEQTTFFELTPSTNLLDTSTMKIGLLNNNGKIYTTEDNASYGAYRYFEQYIPVDEGDEISVQYTRDSLRQTTAGGAYSIARVAAYDSEKQILSSLGAITNSTNKVYVYKVPATVKYIRLCLSSTIDQCTDIAVVKNTSDVIPYDEYGVSRAYLKEEHLKKETKDIVAFLPDEISCAVGRTIEIYNKQVCPLAEKYHFRWLCNVGKALERKFSITGTEALIGDYSLTLEIFDDEETCLYSKLCNLKIVSNTLTDNITICPIGDSLTNTKQWLNEVPILSENKISYVGTRGGGKHEGRSGFTSTGYTTAHGYDFEQSNVEDVHPFWDGSKFSWSYYKTNSGINPTAVQIFLGTNDLFNVGTGETLSENIKTMVDSIRLTDANMPIFVVLTILVGSQNGLGKQENSDGFAMYKGKYKYSLDCKFIKAMEVLHDTLKDYENLYFVPLTECHDNEYNFGSIETPVNPRATQMEYMPNEGIHPQQQGYEQMADVMYSVYCRAFAE